MTAATPARGRETTAKIADRVVTTLDEVAETIRDEALAAARERLGALRRSSDLASLLRRPDFFDRFKHEMVIRLSPTLAANDPRLRAVYSFDPSGNADSEGGEEQPPEATMYLLVLVTAPSEASTAFVAALDRALAASLRELPSPKFAQRESVLDVNLITERDVRLGLGLAALLTSVFAPPLKVWLHEE